MVFFAADAHVANHRRWAGRAEAGLNERCRTALAVLELAADRARKARAPLVLLGDTFDSARPEPQVIAAVQRALRGVDVYAMLGNHEQVSTAAGDHALGPLDGHDLIQVIEGPTLLTAADVDLLFVPFRPGRADDWLDDAIVEADNSCAHYSTPPGRRRVMCLHLGIRDGSTPPWLRDSPGSVDAHLLARLMAEHRIDAAVAGDWHSRRRWLVDGREIMQAGALCPTGLDNEGLDGYGTLARFDPAAASGERLSFEELPGPRFVSLRAGDPVVPAAPDGTRLYVRYVVAADGAAACIDQLRAARESGAVVDGEVMADEAQAQEAAREAAEQARSQDTLDGALAAFVGSMEVPSEESRGRVLERCRRFLGTADQP